MRWATLSQKNMSAVAEFTYKGKLWAKIKTIGFTSDGSPLADVLNKHSALNKENIISILSHGCLVGENPKAMARKMTKAGYSDASHALLVARTETMRVAQEVGNENFKANGVDMVQWVSGETPYTCAACWAMSGKVFETGKQPHDHPNGRCVFNPYIPELAELDPDLYKHDPEENFAKLSEEEQKAVLGPKRFEMWKNGELNLTDLADTTDSDDYGESIKIRSLGDIADGSGSGQGGGSGSGGGPKNKTHKKVDNKENAQFYELSEQEKKEIINGKYPNGIKVDSFSDHFYEREEEREVSPEDIKYTLENPLKITEIRDDKYGGSYNVISEKATVAINPKTNNMITVHKTHSKLIKKLKKLKN